MRELAQKAQRPQSTKQVDVVEIEETSFELSPIQHVFFHACPQGEKEYTQSFCLRLTRHVAFEALQQALTLLVKRHSMLRARFAYEDSTGWSQIVAAYRPESFKLGARHKASLADVSELAAAPWTQIDVQEGPTFAATFCNMSDGAQILLLTAHHLVIDLVSWRILLEELERLLLSDGSTARLASTQSQSFQVWTKLQVEHIRQRQHVEQQGPLSPISTNRGYWGLSEHHSNKFGETDSVQFSIDKAVTMQLLDNSNIRLRTDPIDLFLGACIFAFAATFPDRASPEFYNESHGREAFNDALDPSGIVGWFTTMYPISLDSKSQSQRLSLSEAIRQVKSTRLSLTDRGWYSFTSRFLQTGNSSEMEIIFNYFGLFQQFERQDSLFKPLNLHGPQPTEDAGPSVTRPSLFEVAMSVEEGRLHAKFTYHRNMTKVDRIKRWALTTQELLESIGTNPEALEARHDLADFPLLQTTEKSFKTVLEIELPALGVSASDVEDIYPCSPMQEGLQLSSLQNPQFYGIRLPFEFHHQEVTSDAAVQRLQDAWQTIIDRHAILRTIIFEHVSDNGGFCQVVLRARKGDVTVVGTVNGTSQNGTMSKDLDGSHLHGLRISKSKSSTTLDCVLTISHAITDGISLSLIMRALKDAWNQGRLSEPIPQYKAVISHLQDSRSNDDAAYWQVALSDLKPCLIPILEFQDQRSPHLLEVRVPIVSPEAIKSSCKTNGFTMTTLLHTAWLLVLHCYTGLDAPSFGYLSSGRDIPVEGINEIIGPCVKMLVRHHILDPDQRVQALLTSVQDATFENLNHQSIALGSLKQDLGLTGQELFNTAMTQEQEFDPELQQGKGARIKIGNLHDPTEVCTTRTRVNTASH